MNKKFSLAVVALLICFAPKAWTYDFSAKCESGQTLYYNILSNSDKTVEVTYQIEGTKDNNWTYYEEPLTGHIIIPSRVKYTDANIKTSHAKNATK